MIKPQYLKAWDKVAALTLSWWGPWACPERYLIGKKQLEEEFHVQVVEGKYTLKDPQWIYDHPEARAEDLMDAFQDTSIKAIFSTIWWEESIRLLPYIDFEVMRKNPKIFMWFSDSTITHFFCHKAWIVSFYGPAIMAWFGENCWMFPYMVDSVRNTLFSNDIIGELKPNIDWWTSEHLDWSIAENQKIKRKLQPCTWRRRIQGEGIHIWETLGWCVDVFPFIVWTSIWPSWDEWKWKILVLEPSEEQMPTYALERILRNLWSQWILHVISWILFWRSQLNYQTNIQIDYDETLLKIVHNELWLSDLPIITNMDFGHTDPIMTLPLWCKMLIDCDRKKISYGESACI